MRHYVGTDIGGTFTDIVTVDDAGELSIDKVPTKPGSLAQGVLDALEVSATSSGVPLADRLQSMGYLAHGTTAATNAFIERRGARTALLTTRGFRDIVRLQRAMASWAGIGRDEISHYSQRSNPEPLLPRDRIVEITERVDLNGKVIVPLDEDRAQEQIEQLVKTGVDAFAICFLWSFRNPDHELRVAEFVRDAAPDAYVTTSAELVPILGEYERVSTTLLNAYLGPVVAEYLGNLRNSVEGLGYREALTVMDSGGGVLDPEAATTQAVGLLTSGPAGGVLASAELAEQLDLSNVITTDMGGTSFDVGLIVDGKPVVEIERVVERFHVALPAVKVLAIGAGGGSIARVEAGLLRVGPRSAGAEPGPACYGRGGTWPTVTDADLVLGLLNADNFLAGRMKLDRDGSERAIHEHVAQPLGMSVLEAAAAIREVADNHMADAIRSSTMRVGLDPRDFSIFAFGGAGPTHAYRYAAEAGVGRVVIPATATAHSAFGCVTAPRRRSFSHGIAVHVPAGFLAVSDHLDVQEFNAGYEQLESLAAQALPGATVERSVGMRFRLQVHEIAVPVPMEALKTEHLEAMVDRFVMLYERMFGEGTALRESGVEFTSLRVDAVAPVLTPKVARHVVGGAHASGELTQRKIYFYEIGREELVDIVPASQLAAGERLTGPMIVEYPGTTAVVGPGQRAEFDDLGNLLLEFDEGHAPVRQSKESR